SAKVDGIKDGLTEDDGGHLIASIFDGAGEQINYAPMNANLNRGAWKAMENRWAKALNGDPPKTVKIDIQPIYEGNSKRPEAFEVIYEIDGKEEFLEFANKTGG
uniref:DNA/RNA non-specific endonuclease n=1 Tax=Vibrio atypicus TaxID=558271 RepID=UPI003734D5B9